MEKSKKFNIGQKSFVAKFPNVGQIIDMDSMKQALSGNRYGSMAASGLASAYFALDLIDAISFYTICCPEVGRYFDIKNYAEMELEQSNALVTAWKEQLQPWYLDTMNEIRNGAKKSMTDAADAKGED